ncbi:carbohydrate ABC transporter membrane protein 2, CUT1 family [Fulvimarina manganoxydans]|uniref:Carbohydrate ABC transporter membrane protein 2, CUT1 family n=1 Tax=Fulvimarina manganoxydans TaxID=937218 RepID=A0A1W2E6U7_9HYPH|nr:carbohydrate ABC transporter permease [Fulvimarina manganoxydans]MEE2952923.1 carbohydrate ABC transporter permease [Pseudomonadota bacterium]SMD05046.1 carbohydrate ABC transporter membrane protein 2, CUT1 family [Fulvimarina manganoxydans]
MTAATAKRLSLALSTLVGLLVAAAFLAPILWTILSSFRGGSEAFQVPLPPWPTQGVSVDSYLRLDAAGEGILRHSANSGFVAGMTVVLSVIVSLFAGYGFSRFRFPMRNVLFVLIMATLMIPFQSILTPLFILLAKLGLQNTLIGLVLVYTTLQLPFSIFMMRNAFDAVPKEIEEAARMEGVTTFQMLFRVLLPLVMPGVATVAIFAFLNAWNEFLAALIFLSDPDKLTLPVLIAQVRAGRFGSVDWGAVQAGVTAMMIPCLIVFLALQRFYIRGLTAGAVK